MGISVSKILLVCSERGEKLGETAIDRTASTQRGTGEKCEAPRQSLQRCPLPASPHSSPTSSVQEQNRQERNVQPSPTDSMATRHL